MIFGCRATVDILETKISLVSDFNLDQDSVLTVLLGGTPMGLENALIDHDVLYFEYFVPNSHRRCLLITSSTVESSLLNSCTVPSSF